MKNKVCKFLFISLCILIMSLTCINLIPTDVRINSTEASADSSYDDNIPFDLHKLYLQSDDGESVSSTFLLERGKEAGYQLTNKNANEVSWKLIKKGWLGSESTIDSGKLSGNSQTDFIEINSSSGTYYFKGSTINGATINVYCSYQVGSLDSEISNFE